MVIATRSAPPQPPSLSHRTPCAASHGDEPPTASHDGPPAGPRQQSAAEPSKLTDSRRPAILWHLSKAGLAVMERDPAEVEALLMRISKIYSDAKEEEAELLRPVREAWEADTRAQMRAPVEAFLRPLF